MRHSVTTPGGFFIGLGGIAASLFVAYAVYSLVKKPAPSSALRPQQIALGLVPATDAPKNVAEETKGKTDALLAQAGARYNDGKKPNIDNLEELRGVVRYREAQKSVTTSEQALRTPSKEKGKSVLELAMSEVADQMKKKPTAKSAVKVDVIAPPAGTPASLPNVTGNGVNTISFPPIKPAGAAPEPAPAPAPVPPASLEKPAPAPAPAAAKPPAPAAAPAATSPVTTPAPAAPPTAPEPNRPPLLNGTEPTK
jgi:hypothetical protein